MKDVKRTDSGSATAKPETFELAVDFLQLELERTQALGVARQSGCMWDFGYIKAHLTNLSGQRNVGIFSNRAQDVLQERGCEEIDG